MDYLNGLRRVAGADHVLVGDDLCAGYSRDWTGRFLGRAAAVVRPANTAEVSEALAVCHNAGVSVVPQGGNTGLVGGSVPLRGEVVLSLTRLDDIDPVDRAASQVTVGAGVTLSQLQRHAREADLAFGVDIGARDSATVGGMIATNAGGLRFLRYGGMREQVVGLEAVLADGSVLSHLDGLSKDNTGYHWPSLLCGSEGTLAVVTRARLKLVVAHAEQAIALLAFDSVTEAVNAVWHVRDHAPNLSAAELFLGSGLDLVCTRLNLPRPFATTHAAYVIVECTAATDPTEELGNAVGDIESVRDVAVADRGRFELLWGYRERHTEAIGLLGPPHKLDVTLPASQLAAFVDETPSVVAAVDPSAKTWMFGHVADGNIHVNITGPTPHDETTDDAVLRYVASLGGSISAEHGIGTAKKQWLHLNRSDAEIAMFRNLKHALDPTGILNPHAVLPDAPVPGQEGV
ncbi:MAG TPA: FAD-binding oxidoreductase [Ilumatobacter sp.]|nr:FAD-binding oxidoreductase [Ilumatobacter sp.]